MASPSEVAGQLAEHVDFIAAALRRGDSAALQQADAAQRAAERLLLRELTDIVRTEGRARLWSAALGLDGLLTALDGAIAGVAVDAGTVVDELVHLPIPDGTSVRPWRLVRVAEFVAEARRNGWARANAAADADPAAAAAALDGLRELGRMIELATAFLEDEAGRRLFRADPHHRLLNPLLGSAPGPYRIARLGPALDRFVALARLNGVSGPPSLVSPTYALLAGLDGALESIRQIPAGRSPEVSRFVGGMWFKKNVLVGHVLVARWLF